MLKVLWLLLNIFLILIIFVRVPNNGGLSSFATKSNLLGSPNSAEKTLNKLNLTIKKNSLVGIYGSSGSGKTTLISLIMGLLNPDRGNILVDKIDIKSKIKSWQNIIAYVPQKIFLVDDTIENNIALGEENDIIDRKKLKISAKKSGLDLDTMFYKGGKTMVGESGVRLSSGQIQRIGIARALYKNSEILILDEFTSSLDKKNEQKIMKTIIDLKKTHTIIMISHNSELVQLCDKKIYISSKKAVITK